MLTKSLVYLDNAATTPMRIEVVEAMRPYLTDQYGNPSSLHALGRQSAKALAHARDTLARLLNAPDPETLIWTSGGTESDNMAVKGIAFGLQAKGKHIVTSAIEHAAVLDPCAWLEQHGWTITRLPVDTDGRVSPQDLKAALRSDTVLVSLMHGNNEVGTLQPLAELGQIARDHGVLFHTDAVQTVGKLPLDLSRLPVDLLSASAHKIQGPKGVGLLYVHPEARHALTPLIHGGGQQGNVRSGTENVAGIVGFAQALQLAESEHPKRLEYVTALQHRLLSGLQAALPMARLNGPQNLQERVPGNINVSFAPLEGESLVLRLDLENICVSSGSACHSAELTGSHVLTAMGRTAEEAKSSLRFSIGPQNSEEDIDRVLEALPRVLEKAGYFRNPSSAATIK